VPTNWNQTTSLPSNAALQAVDRFRGWYLTIISEPLDEFEAQVGLPEYTDLVMSNRLRKQDLTKVTGPSQRTVASQARATTRSDRVCDHARGHARGRSRHAVSTEAEDAGRRGAER
jgi:hypothetical protein